MQAHRVIAAFKHRGMRITPPGPWTPPTQAVADKLIAAGCLKRPAASAVQVPTLDEVRAAGYSEAAAHAIVARQQALADGKSDGEAYEAARAAAAGHSDEVPAEAATAPAGEQPEPAHAPDAAQQSEEITQKQGEPEAVAAEPAPAPPPAPAEAATTDVGAAAASAPVDAPPAPAGEPAKSKRTKRSGK